MKFLDNTPITDVAQFPVKKGTLQFLQLAHKETAAAILNALIGPSYNYFTVYIIFAADNTGTFPAYNIAAGYAYYAGEIFGVLPSAFTVTGADVGVWSLVVTQYTTDADPVTFTDTSVHNVHDQRYLQLVAGASGTGYGDFSATVYAGLQVTQATESQRGTAEIATSAEMSAGTSDATIVTPLKLANVFAGWQIRSDTTDVTITGGSGTTTTSCNIKYKIINKVMHIAFAFTVTNSTVPTSFKLLLPESKSVNFTFNVRTPVVVLDNTTVVSSVAAFLTGDPTKILITPGTALTNTSPTTVSGTLTIEIA